MEHPSAPFAACLVDDDDRIVAWSSACERLTGFPAAQVQGLPLGSLMSIDAASHRTQAACAERCVIGRLRRPDGVELRLRAVFSPAILAPEAPPAWSVVLVPLLPVASPAALLRELPVGHLIEELPCVFYVIDKDGHLQLWNRLLEQALERTPAELRGMRVESFFDPAERPAITARMNAALMLGESSHEGELVGKHGKRTSFLFHCARTTLGGQPGLFGTGLDITERKRIEHGLRVRERAIYSSVNAIVITCCDRHENKIEYVNPAFEQLTGYSLREVKGRDPRFMGIPDCDEPERQRIREAIQACRSVHAILRNRRKNGEVFYNDLRIDPVRGLDGEVTHFVGVLNDVTASRHYERRLRHLAHHDPLTGLANRTLLMDRLREAVERARRDGTAGALAFVDLDNFKHINDSLGHEAGDRVLQEVAARLRANMRDEDLVARIGGDEFVLLVHEALGAGHVGELLERVRRSVNAPVELGGREVVPGISVGASLFPNDGDTVDAVMRAADAAMYHAKALGKNNVQFYSDELGSAMRQYLLLQASLSRAIRNRELVLGFQPKVDLRSGKVVGAEALVRWQRPNHGLVGPDSFIPVAEETGLIVPLGQWVIHEACKALRSLGEEGLDDVVISVNLSAHQLRQRRFAQQLGRTLRRYRVAPQRFELEVTESQLMDRPGDAMDALDELKALGVRLSIDDFGTGYSSLSRLRKFPVDYIKIDRSFLGGPCDDEHTVIPRAIIALGHSLKLQVVAEGVETREQVDFLRAQGCDQIQGYYFSPAVPSERLRDMLRSDTRLPA
ncbi:hypothetical protein B0920_05620 [Massilia sp. KIM]|uniref:sensor domain-containing protein n=1 Tax=Massilia sp. KIM TaxID=1955422 RepID=UPI00098EA953|nr:bifunctional diguanylate cyclase/phosphodiesterase [Massilia sp. KIM]OON62906.1 hypothetical protein B0920_05620 [Massilia sp. KIM]